MALAKFLNLSVSDPPHLQDEGNTCPTSLPSRANEIASLKELWKLQSAVFKKKTLYLFPSIWAYAFTIIWMFRHHRCILVDSRENLAQLASRVYREPLSLARGGGCQPQTWEPRARDIRFFPDANSSLTPDLFIWRIETHHSLRTRPLN